jgi:hypothetical protein
MPRPRLQQRSGDGPGLARSPSVVAVQVLRAPGRASYAVIGRSACSTSSSARGTTATWLVRSATSAVTICCSLAESCRRRPGPSTPVAPARPARPAATPGWSALAAAGRRRRTGPVLPDRSGRPDAGPRRGVPDQVVSTGPARAGAPRQARLTAGLLQLGHRIGTHPVRPLRRSGRRRSAHVAGVAEAVAPRLGPHAQAVRSAVDVDPLQQPAGPGVQDVDDAVVAAGEPEGAPVGADPAHVG